MHSLECRIGGDAALVEAVAQQARVVCGHVLLLGASDGVVVLHHAHGLPHRVQVRHVLRAQVRQRVQLLAHLGETTKHSQAHGMQTTNFQYSGKSLCDSPQKSGRKKQVKI